MSELAEGARLEIVCAVKSGTEGSNPSLSAITLDKIFIFKPTGHQLSTAAGRPPGPFPA